MIHIHRCLNSQPADPLGAMMGVFVKSDENGETDDKRTGAKGTNLLELLLKRINRADAEELRQLVERAS